MKRADQHNMIVSSPLNENYSDDLLQPDDTGIDMPSEKDIPSPAQQPAPSMGALPVDILGSVKTDSDWKSGALDETHAASESTVNADDNSTETVAVGNGPDPEHSDF